MIMSRDQNAGRSHNIKTDDSSFERVEQFKYLGTTLTNKNSIQEEINPLTLNDHYSGRAAPLTSKRFILYIYSANTGTEYFKHSIYSPYFSLFKMQFVS